ncbi:MAG: nicotinamide riboside transporter PnuC [Pseudomonadota bacterium]
MATLSPSLALESLAVLLAVAYLVLAARENIWCWLCAFVSTAIYIGLFYRVALLSESLLNVFYLGMAVYGWWQWRSGVQDQPRKIQSWPLRRHALVILAAGAAVPVLGLITSRAGAAFPYVDAATTCFAVATTFMVTHKVLENWLYWLVIDGVSIYLYLEKGLKLTAALFGLYLVICVFGYLNWRRRYTLSQPAVTPA